MPRVLAVLLASLVSVGCASSDDPPPAPPSAESLERDRWRVDRATLERYAAYVEAEWSLGSPAPANARLLAGADRVVLLPATRWSPFPDNDARGFAVLEGPEDLLALATFTLSTDAEGKVRLRLDRDTKGTGWLAIRPGPNRGELTLVSEAAEFASLVLSAKAGVPSADAADFGRLRLKPNELPE